MFNMFMFVLKLLLWSGVFWFARTQIKPTPEGQRGGTLDQLFGDKVPVFSKVVQVVGVLLFVWTFIGIHLVHITPNGYIGTMQRNIFAKSPNPGQIVAFDGELGPQARILRGGWHFEPFVDILYSINEVPVLIVPQGQCAIMSAKDGLPPAPGTAFAEPWADPIQMVSDAEYFLTEGQGRRGPQSTCLLPAVYTINPFLWEAPRLVEATRVEQGTVGVIKSSIRAAVDFGESFRAEMPVDNTLQVLSVDLLPEGAARTSLVPVGSIGVWEVALPNGLYYINTDAYRVTMIPTVAQVYEYKGGYIRKTVDVTIGDDGQIIDRIGDDVVVPTPETSADTAIFAKPEGWDVAQELRVLVQVDPQMAPFVVASLGLTQENASQVMEDRVVTPIIRSVVRDVLGGAQIPFRYQQAILGDDGFPILDANGEPTTRIASEFRPVRVLDLLDQRASIEEAIENRVEPEALKEGVTVNEVRLSESSLPPELLIARKREQLAQQLKTAWAQEEIAQVQRQATENAKARAAQQSTLVQAQIGAQAAQERANGRRVEGEGERDYLTNIAQGQRESVAAIGEDNVLKLQMVQQLIAGVTNLAEKQPGVFQAFLSNPQKFVPTIVVGGGTQGIEGAASIFGGLMSGLFNQPQVAQQERRQ